MDDETEQRIRIVDADTHVIELPDVWTERLPRSWGDRVMQVRWSEPHGEEMWFLDGRAVKRAWSQAIFGWDMDAHGFADPPTFADVHPAAKDIRARVALMDAWGIDVAVLYPNIAAFGSLDPFLEHPDAEVAFAHVSAYNDWQLDWASQARGRFVPMIALPYWDVERSVAEIERLGAEPFGGVVTTGAPHQHGLPHLPHPHWEPLWRACEVAGLSVSFHIANGNVESEFDDGRAALEDKNTRVTRVTTAMSLDNAKQVVDLLMSGILARHPELRFVSVEAGMGWVPFVLENLDLRFKSRRVDREHPEFGDLLPSDLFRRQVAVPFFVEELLDFHVEKIGLGSLLFETDFPHRVGLFAQGIEGLGDDHRFDATLDLTLGRQPRHVKEAVLWENPAALYRRSLEAQGVAIEPALVTSRT